MMIIQGTIELRYNIRSAWFLDIRISTCYHSDQSLLPFKFKIFVLNSSLFTYFVVGTIMYSYKTVEHSVTGANNYTLVRR